MRGYSLDDVLLEPQFSSIRSRLDTDTSTYLTDKTKISSPIMATNMSTITELDMMEVMNQVGGVGALHRFMKPYKSVQIVADAVNKKVNPVVSSIGIGDEEYHRATQLMKYGHSIILIDVAHGHSIGVVEQLAKLKQFNPNGEYIVGNIATGRAANDFINYGASALRVGIGGGSRCLTRTVTGHGVPNLTALLEVAKIRDKHYKNTGRYVPVIIDGGIKNSGDMVKALYFGADVICIGNLLAGTEETPGEKITRDGKHFKKYYGMASKEAQDTHRGGMKAGTASEGFSELVPYKGSAKPILEELIGGIRSGLTYSGARNIIMLRQKGKPIYISDASRGESKL
jgi:IMP dehydrogenase